MPTYNTVMAVAAGAALLSIARLCKRLYENQEIRPLGICINFGMLGTILFCTGLHMTLTWPMAKYFPFDNIIFGEPSLTLGVLLLGLSFYFRQYQHQGGFSLSDISKDLYEWRFLLYGIGLALIAIGFAGVTFQLFAAPKEEPISGNFADYPMLEATFISLLYALTGLSALLTPPALRQWIHAPATLTGVHKATYVFLMLTGTAWLLFGALNFFTHIGLIVHTM
ncbi:DUF981 family protein [Chitinophaga varians]|nr:DUF981 family protein [Chitinophaga varians]